MMASLVAIFGETRKSILISWTYRANTLVGMVTISLIFLGIGFLMGDGQFDLEEMNSMYVGIVGWYYAMMAMNDLSFGIRGEINAGTLEQMSMSRLHLSLVLMGRILANLFVNTIEIIIIGLALTWLIGINIPMNWQGVVALLLMMVGVWGFGYVIAGATLIFKQIESLANLFSNILVFLNGSLLPVTSMPTWMASISLLLPTTLGVVVLRGILLEGQSLQAAWMHGSLKWLLVQSVAYYIGGYLFFKYCERVAKQHGSLGQY